MPSISEQGRSRKTKGLKRPGTRGAQNTPAVCSLLKTGRMHTVRALRPLHVKAGLHSRLRRGTAALRTLASHAEERHGCGTAAGLPHM